jgi:hypothetical protein
LAVCQQILSPLVLPVCPFDLIKSEMSLLMQNMTRRDGKMTPGTHNDSAYIELLKTFPPRPIVSKQGLFATQKVIDSLIDRGKLTPDEQDYLNVLGTLVYEYEQRHEPLFKQESLS